MIKKPYYVYIMTNINNTVLYTGVTNDLQRRVFEHRTGKGGSFTKRYKIYKLVYYEEGNDIYSAMNREKAIKAGSRMKKVGLIISLNPNWDDLYEKFFG